MTTVEVKMEIHVPQKKDFMGKLPRFEPVILDHTAMITAKQCLRKYFYQIVLGRTSKDDAPYFPWGSAYHQFRYTLEKVYGFGDNAPKVWDEEKANKAFSEALAVGVTYWKQNGADQGPESKFSWMTSARLVQSFAVAFKHWSIEKKRGNIEVVAIEQPFNIQLKDGSHRGGTADQIVKWMGKLWGRDFKTTSKDSPFYQRTLIPNEQFSGYTFCEEKLSGEKVTGQIVEVLYNSKSTKQGQKGPDIWSLTASRTPYDLETWEKDHIFWNKIVTMSREEDHYPMSEVNCSFCPYHLVCKQGSEAGQVYQLETAYDLRPWDYQRIGE